VRASSPAALRSISPLTGRKLDRPNSVDLERPTAFFLCDCGIIGEIELSIETTGEHALIIAYECRVAYKRQAAFSARTIVFGSWEVCRVSALSSRKKVAHVCELNHIQEPCFVVLKCLNVAEVGTSETVTTT
jgi:hypothetical protein